MENEIKIAAEAYLEAMKTADIKDRAMAWFGLDDLAVNGIGLKAAMEAVDKQRCKHTEDLRPMQRCGNPDCPCVYFIPDRKDFPTQNTEGK